MKSSTIRRANPCLVCGDKSIGFNFGVLTCMACKAFFRRNAVKLGSYNFICPKDGDCPTTHTFRRLCNCCRLAKCFRVGMRKELILSEAEKEARRLSAARNRAKREKALKTEDETLELIPVVHSPGLALYRSSYLSSSEQNLLRNVYNAYESTCVAEKASQYHAFPLRRHTNLFEYLNEYSSAHKVLIEYIKVIPEFNNLPMNDRVCLTRNQFGVINNINEAVIHPGVSTNLVVSLSNIFGIYLANRLLQSIDRIEVFTYDPLLLKLFLIIIALSSGNYRNRPDHDFDQICDDTLSGVSSTECLY